MKTEFNAGRVGVARMLLGVNQETLAADAGIAQSQLSQMENGLRALSEETAWRLAGASGLPIEFFAEGEAALEPQQLNFRKLAGASVRTTKRIAVQYGELRRVASKVLTAAQVRVPKLPYAQGAVALDDIEGIAGEVRHAMGYSDEEPVRHLIRSLERLGVAFGPLAAVGDKHPVGHDGVSGSLDREGRVVVGYVPADAGDRIRLSNGHEIGHIVLHTRRPDVPDRLKEQEAMRFAVALLVPKRVAVEQLSETVNLNGYLRLKAKWGVSVQALIRRGFDLGVISHSRYRSLNVQVSRKGWRKAEPVEVETETPALLWKGLTAVYGTDPYDAAVPDVAMRRDFLETWIPPRPISPSRGRGTPRLAPVKYLFGKAS